MSYFIKRFTEQNRLNHPSPFLQPELVVSQPYKHNTLCIKTSNF